MRNDAGDSMYNLNISGDGLPKAIRRLLAVAVCALAMLPASASAATITVNDDAAGVGPAGATCATPESSTISGAVLLANPFDTIAVCSGTYAETVDMGKRLVLVGPQAGVDARARTGVPEAIIDPSAALPASGIGFTVRQGATVDGFTFRGATATALDYNSSASPGHTENIRNNIFSSNSTAVSGILGKDSAFTQNRVVGPTFRGLEVKDSTESLEVTRNLFEGVTGTDIYFMAPGPFDDTYINGNSHSSGSGGFVELRNNDDTEITSNLIVGAATAIYIGGSNNGTYIGRNVISGGGGADAVSIAVEGGLNRNSRTQVFSNSISGKLAAVRIAGGSATTSDPVEVQFNRLVGNAAGIVNGAGSGGSVMAMNNFWGCNEGPGASGCDTTTGDVDSDPNLVLRVNASPLTIGTGGETSNITADVFTNSDGVQVVNNVGAFPGGQPVPFTTSLGSVSPASTLLSAGSAKTKLTSRNEEGTARVRATLDNETALVRVAIDDDPNTLPDQPTTGRVGCIGVRKGRIIRGTPEADRIVGTSDGERIRGRGGNDKIIGKEGHDCISGGRGKDRIMAVDGKTDRIKCGGRFDVVTVDPVDIVKDNCEKIRHP